VALVAGPGVVILESGNVVLAKVVSALHLDKDQRDRSGISDSVFGSHWNESFLIRTQPNFFIVQCDNRFAGDDNPVFATALMHLQTEAVAWMNDEAFDFVVFALREHFIHSPGTFISLDRHR
jgi:hypothetical protein